MRIIDRINAISNARRRSKESSDDGGMACGFFYSFEFFPPKVCVCVFALTLKSYILSYNFYKQ